MEDPADDPRVASAVGLTINPAMGGRDKSI